MEQCDSSMYSMMRRIVCVLKGTRVLILYQPSYIEETRVGMETASVSANITLGSKLHFMNFPCYRSFSEFFHLRYRVGHCIHPADVCIRKMIQKPYSCSTVYPHNYVLATTYTNLSVSRGVDKLSNWFNTRCWLCNISSPWYLFSGIIKQVRWPVLIVKTDSTIQLLHRRVTILVQLQQHRFQTLLTNCFDFVES